MAKTLELRPDRASESTPESASQIFSSLPEIRPSFLSRFKGGTETIIFEIFSYNQITHFLVHIPVKIASYVESQIAAQYPKAGILEAEDRSLRNQIQGKYVSFGSIELSSPYYLPLRTWQDYTESDPLSAMLGAMAKTQPGDIMLIQIAISAPKKNWRKVGLSVARAGGGKNEEGVFLPHPKADLIEKKISLNGFQTGIKILTAAENQLRSSQLGAALAGAFGALSFGGSNSLVFKSPRFYQKQKFLESILERKAAYFPKNQILSVDELATIFHLPNNTLAGIKNVAWGGSFLGEPPENLPVVEGMSKSKKTEINFIGKAEFKNKMTAFGVRKEDRRRHMYIIGKSGTGKSTLIANMVINDMRNGEGLAVVDPHGDLSEILLDYIPSYRINDVAYLDAAVSAKRPFRMNLFEVKNPEHGELVASGVVSIFQKLYGYSWGPRLEYILRNAILTLIARPNSTLVDVPKLLTDAGFRKRVTTELDDYVLKNFWEREFNRMGDRLQSEAISPILNKVGQFVSSPTIREIIGYPNSTIDLEDAMNNGKIVILNLSQGRLGEDNAALLGAMLITKIQLAAMNRASVPEAQRRDFYLFVDEFQNFATTSFIKILSEARKYRLNLTLANQYIGQVPEEVQDAIFGNVGTLMSFLIGAEDAAVLTKEFGGAYTEEDLVSLDKYQVAMRLAIDGRSSRPFIAYTLPLPSSKNQNKEKVIRVSRERYTREAVKKQIDKFEKTEPKMEKDVMNSKESSTKTSGGTIYKK